MYCFTILSFLLITARCTPHKAFVASPYEPLLVEKKNDLQVSAGIRPFKYYNLEATYAPANFMALRLGAGGFFDLYNLHLSVPFFKSTEKTQFFAAPAFSYQRNTIARGSAPLFANRKSYRYNCEYISPGLALGFTLKGKNNDSHHLLFKAQYNVVQKYYYSFERDNGSGKSSSYMVIDNETLSYPLPDFLSFEPGYAYTSGIGKNFLFKFQASFNFCQRVLKHKYTFQRGDYSNPQMTDATQFHPVTRFFYVSFGVMFRGNVRKSS